MKETFSYTGRSAEGGLVRGTIAAESSSAAAALLRARSVFITALYDRRSAAGSIFSLFALPPNGRTQVTFYRSFATLIACGVEIRRALVVSLEQCRDDRFCEALRSLVSDIENGTALSVAMARRPREFAPLTVAMIHAGEIGGGLQDVLGRLADFIERDQAMKKRLLAALTYPAVVAISAIALVAFLVATVVPAFASMFDQMHVTLPFTTRLVIAAGNTLRSPMKIAVLIACLLIIALLISSVRQFSRASLRFDMLKLRVPVIGGIARKVVIARFSRTLGTLVQTGVALTTAIDVSVDVIDNAVYRTCVASLGQSLRQGESLTPTLEASRLFEPLFLQLVRVGEETGRLDAMFLDIARHYESDVEHALAALVSIVEPLLIVVLGSIVGTIVASVLVPLYSAIGSIQ